MDSNSMCEAPLSWSDTLTDFLNHVKISEISQHRQPRPKQIKVNRPIMTMPKETQITDARKLIRAEKFHKLTDLKQDKIIGLKLQEFKESLEKDRHYQLGFDGEYLKRKSKISTFNYAAKLPNRNTSILTINKASIPTHKERSFRQLQIGCEVIDKNIRKFEKQVRTIDSTSTKESEDQTKGLQLIKRQKEVLNEPFQKNEEKVIKKNTRQKITSSIKTKNIFISNYVAQKNKQYYFSKWKLFVRLQINKRNEEKKWREKINSFMQRLHERSKVQPTQLHLKQETPPKSMVAKRNKVKNMENRAVALEPKDTDLKEIVEETLKSRSEAQHQLRPTSVKALHPNLKGKAKLIGLVAGREKSMEVLSNPQLPHTTPPILLTMDQKHKERKKRLADIQEKKRLIDEEKDRQAKIKYEQKILEAELEKKRKLREFREKLKKQQMDQEKKKEEWRKLKQLNESAISLYNNKLLSQTMNIWRNLWLRRRKLNEIAEKENNSRMQRRVLEAWQEAIKIIEEERSVKAVALRIKHLKIRAFTQFKELMIKRRFQMQAAEDWYDYSLARKYFQHWIDFLLQEQIDLKEKWNTAVVHYKTKLMAKTLQHWMLLPQILVLEIEKQNRMQEWREKIQQVLPDFRPIISANF